MPQVITLLASTVTSDGERVISVSDRAAVALGLECGANPIAGYFPGDRWAAEFALAAGFSQTQVISENWPNDFDLICIGAGFLESVGDAFAAQLAERRSATLLFDVLSCDRRSQSEWTMIRDAGRGARDVIAVTGAVVIVVATSVPRPPYVSRSRRQRARQSQIDHAAVGNTTIPWQPVRPRTRRANTPAGSAAADQRMDSAFGVSTESPTSKNVPIVADPDTCARHLMRYLAHHGFLQPHFAVGEDAALADSSAVTSSVAEFPMSTGSQTAAIVRADSASVVRRPRKPGDTLVRRQRQPRPLPLGQAGDASPQISNRRPRRVGGPSLPFRGPRRLSQDNGSTSL